MRSKAMRMLSIVLVCIAVQLVCASHVLNPFKSSSGVDFEAFNKWLTRSLEDEDDVEQNLAHVRSHLNQLANPRVKRAAEIFLECMEAQECDGHLLRNAKRLFRHKVYLQGPRRVERLLGSRLDFVTESCGRYLDASVQEIYNNSLQTPDIGHFLEVVVLEPHGWHLPVGGACLCPKADDSDFCAYISEHHNRTLDLSPASWANYLSLLGWDDSNAIVTEKVLHETRGRFKFHYRPENFKYAYNRYLVKPCKALTSSLGQTFMDVYGISQSEPTFVFQRSATVKQLLYGFKVCEALLTLHPFIKRTICLWARL